MAVLSFGCSCRKPVLLFLTHYRVLLAPSFCVHPSLITSAATMLIQTATFFCLDYCDSLLTGLLASTLLLSPSPIPYLPAPSSFLCKCYGCWPKWSFLKMPIELFSSVAQKPVVAHVWPARLHFDVSTGRLTASVISHPFAPAMLVSVPLLTCQTFCITCPSSWSWLVLSLQLGNIVTVSDYTT